MADDQKFQFVAPITSKYRESFYSSIPVSWVDPTGNCVTCLPCARDTFSPPTQKALIVDGKTVIPSVIL